MLAGKNVLVTGSTGGIGLGIARAFAGAGCNVALNGRSAVDKVETLRAEIDSASEGKIIYVQSDLTTSEGVEKMISTTKEQLGSIDVLVNNAGIQHVDAVEDFPVEKWDMVLALNLSATFHAMRLVLADMKEKDWGRIINIASVHGLVASLNKAAYVASKHAVLGLGKVAALETAETGVTVNTICPGWVRTDMVEKQIEARAEKSGRTFDEEKDDLLGEKQPSKAFVTVEQLGEAALFLASDAASQMTGSTMVMDGGWTSQ